MSGYVRIHRSLIGHPAFRNESEAMAFAWLIMRAAWRPTRVRYKGHSINLQRGQLAISVRDFADAHDRNKNWVSRVLQRLRDEDMIETDAGTGVLIITICKYDEYQSDAADKGTEVGTQNGTAPGTRRGTRAGQRRDTEQRREEGKNISSATNVAGGEAADGVKPIFDLGVSILTNAGCSAKEARSLIGKWRKARGETAVREAFEQCVADEITEPVAWLTRRLEQSRYISASGYEYRGDIDQVIRESEKRADWNVHWRAVGDKRRSEEQAA